MKSRTTILLGVCARFSHARVGDGCRDSAGASASSAHACAGGCAALLVHHRGHARANGARRGCVSPRAPGYRGRGGTQPLRHMEPHADRHERPACEQEGRLPSLRLGELRAAPLPSCLSRLYDHIVLQWCKICRSR